MTSRLARIAQGMMEAGWLLALMVAPLYFDVQSDRVFEPDKIVLIRWLAIIVASAWLVWAVDVGWSLRQPGERWGDALRRLFKEPFITPTFLIVLSYIISTVFSANRYVSFFGSYQRLQGTWTTYSYILIFLVVLNQLRRREQLERLITVVVITSVPISLYGILQHYGVDPLPWGGDVQKRIAGHMGNAIFIAAYLIMVVFLTLYRVIRSFAGILADEEGTQGYSDAILGGLYLFILTVQLIALVFSVSRGPFLGLMAGGYLFVLLAFLAFRPRHYRALAGGWVGLALLGAVFLVVFNLPQTPLEPLKEMPYVGRFGRILDVSRQNPTGRVRVLIWEGAVKLILPHEPLNIPPDMHPDPVNPVRPLIGYGPESMWVVYNRFYQPELGQLEKRNASPDRSHNETFDSLVRTGVLGFAAYVWLFISIFYYVLSWLGLIRSRRDGWLFIGSWFGFGVLSVLTARILDGSWRLFGVSLPFGFIVGLVVYVTFIGLTSELPTVSRQERERYLLLLALLATIAAHYVEVNFGIAIVSTRTYFWTLAAVLATLGTGKLTLAPIAQPTPAPAPAPTASSRKKRRKRRTRAAAPPPPQKTSLLQDATFWAYAILLAFIFITLAYEFIINLPTGNYLTDRIGQIVVNSLFTRVHRGVRVSNPHQFYMLIFTWLVLALLLTGEVCRRRHLLDLPSWLTGVGVYTLSAWGGFLFMAWIQARFHAQAARLQVLASRQPDAIVQLADHMASYPVPYYVLLFLTVMAVGVILAGRGERSTPWAKRSWTGFVAVAGLAFSLYIGFGPSLRPIQADIYFKQAKAFGNGGRYVQAERVYQKVLKLAPHEDYYYLFYGKTLLDHAQRTRDAQERERLLNEAEQILLKARDLNPLNTDHTANLGRFYIARARMVQDPQQRQRYIEKGVEYFRQAVSLSPNNARLRDEYAIALLQAGREEEALQQLHQALKLDDTYYLTYLYLADYYRNKEDWDKAITYYQQALERHPNDVQILSGLAYAYARKGDIDRAIEYNMRVLELRPQDPATLRNLALLYREKGNIAEALRYARMALEVAPEQERASLQALIQQLEQGSNQTP